MEQFTETNLVRLCGSRRGAAPSIPTAAGARIFFLLPLGYGGSPARRIV